MSAEDDEIDAEVRAFLGSEQMDKNADYSARGREYQSLADDELRRAWIEAFTAMAYAGIPSDPAVRQRERDLASEIILRGDEPPYSSVKEAADQFRSAVMPRVKADPQALERVTDSLEVDIAKFWSRRHAKN
jgi:hypothetical protein